MQYCMTSPHTPAQNGIAERLNRTFFDHECCMIFEADLPPTYWQEGVAYACYLKNRTATNINSHEITLYEAFTGRKPNVAILQQFGSPCHVLDLSGSRGKLDPKTKPACFMGIAENQGNSYRYILDGGRQVLHSRNVYFPKDSKTLKKPLVSSEDDWISSTTLESLSEEANEEEEYAVTSSNDAHTMIVQVHTTTVPAHTTTKPAQTKPTIKQSPSKPSKPITSAKTVFPRLT